jgi:hypothetical protein
MIDARRSGYHAARKMKVIRRTLLAIIGVLVAVNFSLIAFGDTSSPRLWTLMIYAPFLLLTWCVFSLRTEPILAKVGLAALALIFIWAVLFSN